MVLVCLLLAYSTHRPELLPLAIALLLLTMAVPQLLRPVAAVWLRLSRGMGKVVSTGVLTVVFLLVVTPVGLLRRWAGRDPLRVREWKRGRGSVMTAREEVIRPEDMANPY